MGLQIAAAKTRAFRAASGAIEQRLPVSWERLRVVKRSSLTATSPRPRPATAASTGICEAMVAWPGHPCGSAHRMFVSAARAKDLCLQNFAAGRGSTSSLRRLCVDGRDKPGQARPWRQGL